MMERDLGVVRLALVPSPEGDVDIHVVFDDWDGVAHFPAPVADEGLAEFRNIETPNDLEDLFRPWSDEETWASYQEFRNVKGF